MIGGLAGNNVMANMPHSSLSMILYSEGNLYVVGDEVGSTDDSADRKSVV